MISKLRLPHAGLRDLLDWSRIPLQELDLQNNSLRSLENLPMTLKELNVSKNSFTNDGIFFPFPRLEHLNLSDNRINIFEEDDFLACFPSLKTLNLSKNCLKQIHFLHSSDIQVLNVCRNRIQTLSWLPSSLEELNAASNVITMIQSKLPPLLRTIDLTYNSLRYAGLPFHWPSGLRELHLDGNDIERFPRKLPDSLETLTLSRNYLTEIPKKLPESLTSIVLSSNRIQDIPDYKDHKRFHLFLIDDNCLTQTPENFPAVVFDTRYNWQEDIHHGSQRIIKQCWKRYLIRLRLRHFKRVKTVKEELFQVSMMPERWEQVDVIDPVWFRKHSSRSHTVHHSD